VRVGRQRRKRNGLDLDFGGGREERAMTSREGEASSDSFDSKNTSLARRKFSSLVGSQVERRQLPE